ELGRVATAVDSALQAFPAVSLASYLFSPAVSFVHNRAQFLHRQRRLRYQLAILANAAVTNPGPMRHINLDPVRAVVELLARGLARLDRSVDDLHPLRPFDLRCVT